MGVDRAREGAARVPGAEYLNETGQHECRSLGKAGAVPRARSIGPYVRGLGLKLFGRSIAELFQRNYASGFRSWCVFCRLMSSDEVCLRRDTSPEEMRWALIDFAAWCLESKGNLASTASGKFAAVQLYHRVEAQVEIIATSPLIRCALKGIARS